MPSAHIYFNKELYAKAVLEENLSSLISLLLSNHYNSVKLKSSKEAEAKMTDVLAQLKELEKEHEEIKQFEERQQKDIELFRKENEEELAKLQQSQMKERELRKEYDKWANTVPDYVWKKITFDAWVNGKRTLDEKEFEY